MKLLKHLWRVVAHNSTTIAIRRRDDGILHITVRHYDAGQKHEFGTMGQPNCTACGLWPSKDVRATACLGGPSNE